MLRGKIVSIGSETFKLQAGATTVDVPFKRVTQVRGPGLSKGAKIGIEVGVGAAVVVVVVLAVAVSRVSVPRSDFPANISAVPRR